MTGSVRRSVSAVFLAFLTAAGMAGCGASLERVRPQALSTDDADLSAVNDDLAMLVVHVNERFYRLNDMLVINTETQERFSLPFFDNFILGSKALPFENVGTDDGVVRHYVFLDLPAGRYQISDIKVASGDVSYDYDELDDLFFEFEAGAPAYLGELSITLDDPLNPRARRPTRVGLFTPSADRDGYLPIIRSRYPALADVQIADGRIWKE
ncbi:MAG: hypothetical protein AAF417_20555 [Pseudomonadota bacterium]